MTRIELDCWREIGIAAMYATAGTADFPYWARFTNVICAAYWAMCGMPSLMSTLHYAHVAASTRG